MTASLQPSTVSGMNWVATWLPSGSCELTSDSRSIAWAIACRTRMSASAGLMPAAAAPSNDPG
ncbi:MAG: hypothetical protein WKF47_02915 [Geodermatophilaceae bacterium]